MYFTNIADDELKPFHKMFGADFHISLTNLLTSKLFKVETVIADKLYRVYPLFYCKEVISNNPEDKVSNVQCLILTRMEHESYLTFKTNNINPSNLDDSYIDIKQIEDKLTVEEFNSIVYRIRKNTKLDGVLNFKPENMELTANDIVTSLQIRGLYDNKILKGLELSGDSVNVLSDTRNANKTFHIYNYNENEWKFIKSINTDSNGKYSFTDHGISSFSDSSETGTQSELQTLINNAIQSGETEITLKKQYKFTSRNPIIINSPLKINGNGHIIDGAGTSRLFNITGDNVTLTDLILRQGNSGTVDGKGGAIQWTGNNGILANTVIADSLSNTNGGAVYWTGDYGEIRNCRFIHNATNGNGGGLYVESEGFKLFDCVSFNNYSVGDGGCTYTVGNNQYWSGFIIRHDTTCGGSRSTFKLNGDYNTIHHFNLTDLHYGGGFIDYTTRVINNEAYYKIVPSTWVDNREDYSMVNQFNIRSKVSATNTGTSQGITRLTGLYGEYKFIDSHRLHTNQGLIINDSLKNKPLRVKLVNPYFRFANYNLTFTVMSITGANIFDDDTRDNIVTDSFTVLLEKNKEVIVDVSNYTNDSILFFNVDASIDFNRHEIIYPPSLRLASDKESIKLNESITLTCKYTDDENKPVTGALITFKESNTSIGTSITNNEGIATITYAPQVLRDYNFIASYNDLMSNTVSVTAESFDGMTLTSDKDILSYNGGDNPETATLTAQLTYEGEPALLEGETVTFEVRKQSDDSLVETLSDVTDSSGKATVSYTSKGAGDLYIKAECSLVSKRYSIIDAIKYTKDGTGINGTYTTGTDGTYDYITSIQSILDPQASLTSSCEVTYKFKVTNTSVTGNGSLLWSIGSDANNGILIGTEGNSNRIRIYSRNNGNNTVQQTINNIFSLNTWFDVKITCNNGTISITVGGQTISYSLSSIAYFKSYTPVTTGVQLTEFMIKPL